VVHLGVWLVFDGLQSLRLWSDLLSFEVVLTTPESSLIGGFMIYTPDALYQIGFSFGTFFSLIFA
jgi:hypothetical protein